jgi:hypothetical protein
LDFPGLILRVPCRGREVLCLKWDGSRWHWLWRGDCSRSWEYGRRLSALSPASQSLLLVLR